MATVIEEPLVSEPIRPLATVTRPTFDIPAGACDVHMHVFGPAERFPHVAHPHYTLPDGRLGHFRELMTILGLTRFVIVQPSYYGTDNTCLLEALEASGDAARGVVMIDEDAPLEDLRRMHAVGVRGLRLDLFKRSGQPLADIQAYITRMAAKIAPLGWHLQFYVPGWVVKDLIPFLAILEIDFVIDHMGYMLEEDGLTEGDFARLIELARSGRCWIKLSAPYRLAKKRGYEAVEGVAKAIVDAAPDRTVWGSDWPHIPGLGRDTGELLNLLPVWASDAVVRRAILVDNPQRLFGFGADA